MAAMTIYVNQVLAEMRPMLTPDGGDVQLRSCDADGVVEVAYLQGSNDECADCVMSSEDFALYLKDLLVERVPGFRELKVV